jgi:recombination protein RecA
MASDKKRKLEMTVAALQAQWGRRAIRRLGDDKAAAVAHIPTGFASLDAALGIGGLPRGRISEIIGAPTSGMSTLALKIAANSQTGGGTAVYVDPDHIFDPDYAARCGLDLGRLLLIHPRGYRQALQITADFVAGGGAAMIVVGVSFRPPAEEVAAALAATLGHLVAPLARAGCALLFLTALPSSPADLNAYPVHSPLPHYAAVRLLVQRERWLYRRRDISGYQAQVLVARNKLGAAGGEVSLALTFEEEV